MNEHTATDLVAGVIQRIYGDATQTVLDRRAAREIVAALRSAGWASLDEVAMLIEAAGGTVTIPGNIMRDNSKRVVYAEDDWRTMGRTFRVETLPIGDAAG